MMDKVLRSGKSFLVLWLVVLFGPAVLATDYQMDVRLDPSTHILTGRSTISWTNNSNFYATDLRFHLYYNAWRSPKTSFLTSNRMRTRNFADWKPDEWSYIDVTSLTVISPLPSQDPEVQSFKQTDLTRKMAFIQPDDGNPNDQTVLRVPLTDPVPPHSSIQIKLEFKSRVPRTFARTGFRDNYFFIAQWFPKLGVFQEDGTWNCHQFIQTEFFSDYGKYDVRMRVPTGWIVGATGVEGEAKDNGDGTTTHEFVQENVHDFAWTTSPDYRVYTHRFDSPPLKPVEMRLLLMPDHAGQQDRYFAATEASLKYYGLWWGQYPYGHITIIDPAYGSRTGGMEYPTLFTGGTRWLSPRGSGNPEGVTVHECGHQFWYGIVGNNEFEDAWMDEGFNTYSTSRVMQKVFGPSHFVRRYLDGFLPYLFGDLLEAPRSAAGLEGFHSQLKWDIMGRPSWTYGPAAGGKPTNRPAPSGRVYSGGAYSVNSYTKPALMLETLENYLGWETFQKVMSTYFERWKFKHPRPQDFFNVVNEVSGRDLSWFWEQTYYSSNIFDYAVDFVDSQDGRQSVVLRRWGAAVFPVEVRITFENGDTVNENWDGKGRWTRFTYERKEKIRTVQVDPEHKLALDVNWTNNSWVRKAPAHFAARKWALKWMIWLQNAMEFGAFFS